MCRDEAFRVLILACSKASRIFCYPSLLLGSMVNIHHILQYLGVQQQLIRVLQQSWSVEVRLETSIVFDMEWLNNPTIGM